MGGGPSRSSKIDWDSILNLHHTDHSAFIPRFPHPQRGSIPTVLVVHDVRLYTGPVQVQPSSLCRPSVVYKVSRDTQKMSCERGSNVGRFHEHQDQCANNYCREYRLDENCSLSSQTAPRYSHLTSPKATAKDHGAKHHYISEGHHPFRRSHFVGFHLARRTRLGGTLHNTHLEKGFTDSFISCTTANVKLVHPSLPLPSFRLTLTATPRH